MRDSLLEQGNYLKDWLFIILQTMFKKNGRRSITLTDAISSFDDLRLHKNLLKVKDSLVDIYRNEFDWQTSVENSLSSLGAFGNTWTDADKSTSEQYHERLLKRAFFILEVFFFSSESNSFGLAQKSRGTGRV
jgi:hypothetical protein